MRQKYLCKNLEVKVGRGLFSGEYGTNDRWAIVASNYYKKANAQVDRLRVQGRKCALFLYFDLSVVPTIQAS